MLVEADRPGFLRGKRLKKMGMKASDTAELFCDDVRVPVTNPLGEENRGFAQVMGEIPRERLSIATIAMAASQKAFDTTIAFAREREVFGQRPRDVQATQFRMAEMKPRLAVGRAHRLRIARGHQRLAALRSGHRRQRGGKRRLRRRRRRDGGERPNQSGTSRPGKPASTRLGTSGSGAARSFVVMPTMRAFLPWCSGSAVVGASNGIATWPEARSASAGGLPRWGTCTGRKPASAAKSSPVRWAGEPAAEGAKGSRPGGARGGEEGGERRFRQRGRAHQHHIGLRAAQAEAGEIGIRVVVEPRMERLGDAHHRGPDGEQPAAIRRRFRDGCRADVAACAGTLPWDATKSGPPRHRAFTAVVHAGGLPGISIPCDPSPEGLRIGIQAIGAFGADRLAVALARQYEAARHRAERWPRL